MCRKVDELDRMVLGLEVEHQLEQHLGAVVQGEQTAQDQQRGDSVGGDAAEIGGNTKRAEHGGEIRRVRQPLMSRPGASSYVDSRAPTYRATMK